jgi:hypothetical protein
MVSIYKQRKNPYKIKDLIGACRYLKLIGGGSDNLMKLPLRSLGCLSQLRL